MCDLCHDTGFLARDPEGETIYCEDCARGLVKALRALGEHLEMDRDWLARHEAEGVECGWEQGIFALELEEYERLRGLLGELERDGESADLHAEY